MENISENINTTESKEVDDPVKYDGIGAYYQVIIKDIGYALVRTKSKPTVWGENSQHLVYFPNYWGIQNTGDNGKQKVTLVRSANGMYIAPTAILMVIPTDRDEPLVQSAIRNDNCVLEG